MESKIIHGDCIEEMKNPYPHDIFPALEPEDMEKIVKLIEKHTSFSPDRVSAQLMRVSWENCKNEILNLINFQLSKDDWEEDVDDEYIDGYSNALLELRDRIKGVLEK